MGIWNPWHGCKKLSEGCRNCYVYRRDESIGKDSSEVYKTATFNLPIKRRKNGEYILADYETVYTCMTSDFFLKEADEWRDEIWKMIKERSNVNFIIITKRIDRFKECIPDDWLDGYDNVTICCTCENQKMADYRLPIFLDVPIKHKTIIHEPMLESINIEQYLASGQIEQVTCGGESGNSARVCDYDWILNTREQCLSYNVSFFFKQTGAKFRKDGKVYQVPRKYQLAQAEKANISFKKRDMTGLFKKLSLSKFRSSFHLSEKDKQYITDKGMDVIHKHCEELIQTRLAPEIIENDGKQTPMKGHPVFIAQHATGTCCRGCLEKWHHIPKGKELTDTEVEYVVNVIMEWIQQQLQE